jgi:hypothetical protein
MWVNQGSGESYYLCDGCHDQRDYYAGPNT